MERDSTGARRVYEIAELTSQRRDPYTTQPIMQYVAGAHADSGDNVVRYALSQRLTRRLEEKRESVPQQYRVRDGASL